MKPIRSLVRRLPAAAVPALAALATVAAGCASSEAVHRPTPAARLAAARPSTVARNAAISLPPTRNSRLVPHEPHPSAAPRARPMETATGGAGEIARLCAEERGLLDRQQALSQGRCRNVALVTALQSYATDPSQRRRLQLEDALTDYREDPTMRKIGAVALTLTLATACNSVSSQVRALNAEERELSSQIEVIQCARKANIALTTALQQYERDGGTAKSERAVEKAREAYSAAKSRL